MSTICVELIREMLDIPLREI